MPRTLKRRSDAISRDESESDISPAPTQRRQRRRTTTPSSADNSEPEQDSADDTAQNHVQAMAKKLVRLALSSEHSRQPLRRTDITAKVLKGDTTKASNRPNFRAVFLHAQKTLRDVFGMELVNLPSRERTTLNDRRKAATQKATQKETQQDDTQSRRAKDPLISAQSWILVNVLPEEYRVKSELLVPTQEDDTVYTALYTLIVSILYLHTPTSEDDGNEDNVEPLSDAKLMKFLKRVNITDFVPLGHERNGMLFDKVLARMIKEQYIEKKRDSSTGEEVIEWAVGPRGKREIGRKGVAGLVRGVYGFGVDGTGNGLEIPAANQDGQTRQNGRPAVKMEKADLEKRLKRTLGEGVAIHVEEPVELGHDSDEDLENQPQRRRSGRVRNAEDE